jgi:hypothetical protein
LAIEAGVGETGSDIVALPAYCCYDVATAAVGANARVALYDVLPKTLGPDFESLRRAMEAGARTLVVAHLYGIPVDLSRSRELAEEFDAVLVEDAAQGAGGSWQGRPLGAWGDLGVLSFGRGKGRTGGGGGAVLANTLRGESLLASLPIPSPASGGGLGLIAKLLAQWAFGRPSLYGMPASLPFLGLGETKYKEPWSVTGMAPGPAAALLANWEMSKGEEEKRIVQALRFKELDLKGCIDLGLRSISKPGFIRYPVLKLSASDRNSDRSVELKLGCEKGYPKTLDKLDSLRDRLVYRAMCPGAEQLTMRLRTLPPRSMSLLDAMSDESLRRILCDHERIT